jgi:ATP-dependent DNA helicase RecG
VAQHVPLQEGVDDQVEPGLSDPFEQMQAFNAPTLSRNPLIHYVFAQMNLAEEKGLGLPTLRRLPETHGLPMPRFEYQDPYLVLTIFRDAAADVSMAKSGRRAEQSDEAIWDAAIWSWARKQGAVTTPDIAKQFELPIRTARRKVAELVEAGKLRQEGKGRATKYIVIE